MVNQVAADVLLDRAEAARAAGRGAVAAELYDQAVSVCRGAGNLDGWTKAVLGAASVYLFGAEPGKLPAQLYDVLARTTDIATRARLAAALARCWAYAGQISRAVQFADEALGSAQRLDAPDLLADCLDAALAAHWGPDELEDRKLLASRLDDTAAHVLDPDVRLQAHLWGFQVACETLDIPAMHRQMRALELLGEESSRAMFFAASRRLMLDLLRGRTDTAERLIEIAAAAADGASLADAWMVLKAMASYSAAQSGDTATCAAGAAECEAFARAEGITAIGAEAAFLWVCAGDLDRARLLIESFHGQVLVDLPRDVNWLLILQCVLEAGLAVADGEIIETASRLLAPYDGRSVINAGAVMFHGVTDDTLCRAAIFLGDPDAGRRLRSRAMKTYERLGAQWWRRRLAAYPVPDAAVPGGSVQCHLHPMTDGLWLVGPEGAAAPLRALRGFGYIRELLGRPGQSINVLNLVGGGTGTVVESGVGEVIDLQALAAYRRRLADLDQEIAEAEQWSDIGRLDGVVVERDALLGEISRATGLNGRRRTAGSSQERARIAVQKAISHAIDRIATVDRSIALQLTEGITTGVNCTYEPVGAGDPEWILD